MKDARQHIGPPTIFINYRIDDSGPNATFISHELKKCVPQYEVFLAPAQIHGGADWAEAIEEALQSTEVLIAVIGKRWSEGENGKRLKEPKDWVRRELEFALEAQIEVIPVLVNGAQLPLLKGMPPELQPLLRKQFMTIHDEDWSHGMARLCAETKDRLPREQRMGLGRILLSPIGWLLALITGFANIRLGSALPIAVGAALAVLLVFVAAAALLSRSSWGRSHGRAPVVRS